MKKTNQILKGVIIISVLLLNISLFSQNAIEILKKYDQVMFAPKDQYSEITIEIIDQRGNKSIRKASMLQKGTDKRLTRFLAPASQSGIGFLSLPKDVMYIYLPAFGKERRIASHVKNQNFAGTDFSYENMEAVPFSSKYIPKLLETSNSSYVLELKPINTKHSDYSRIILHIDKHNFYGIKTIYYNKAGLKFKELVSLVEKRGNYWVATSATMTNIPKKHSTKMIITKIVFDQGISDNEFTVRNLTKNL